MVVDAQVDGDVVESAVASPIADDQKGCGLPAPAVATGGIPRCEGREQALRERGIGRAVQPRALDRCDDVLAGEDVA